VPNQPHHYQNGYTELLAVLDQFTLVIEPEQIGASAHFYLDLGALPLKKPVELVKALGQAIREKSGLAPAVGLAKGKFPAHVAVNSVKPNRASIVSPGQEAIFLALRAVTLLPLDQELAYRFHLLGLRTLGQLAALPAGAMLAQFEELDLVFPQENIPLPSLSQEETMLAEVEILGLSTGEHVLAHYRDWLSQQGILSIQELANCLAGRRVRAAGLLVVHQSPPTAKGFHFLTLEDETGLLDVIVRPQIVTQIKKLLIVAGFWFK
jgi:error-prone DNA polymerase